jgi:cellulose synthase/poly-beta-1,6-N-acetylglucosamine synthase-like glycosyltransferase
MRRTPSFILVSAITLIGMTYLMINHLIYVSKFTNLAIFYTLMFVHLALKTLASLAATPHTAVRGFDLDSLSVDVVVPIYNEDPQLLAAGIRAIGAQERKPRTLWLIDDGSTRSGEPFHILDDPTVAAAIAQTQDCGVRVEKHRQVNRGKREAQSVAFARSDADIFVTTDSDTYLRPDTLAKLIIPFSRPTTMSVGGAAYGQNVKKNFLTRAIDVGFVMSFIQGRVAEGFFGSVRVHCGILAAYRGEVVRDNLPRFLSQTFLGSPVRAGDDRALTFFSKERGRAEFQPEAIAYSALPENLSHLVRQRLRWARSWCWGTLWLLRRPVLSADFLFTITQTLGIAVYGVALSIGLLGFLTGAISPDLLLWTAVTGVTIGMLSHLRYVVAARQDEPLRSRIATWLVSPLTNILYMTIFLPLYFVAMLRPRPQRTWGTRKTVEVGLHERAVSTRMPWRRRHGAHSAAALGREPIGQPQEVAA